MSKTVYDISKWNPIVDYKVFCSKADGVILRLGYRGNEKGVISLDTKFKEHAASVAKTGTPIGVYFFTNAITEEEAREEANYTCDTINDMGLILSFPIFIDTEYGNKYHNGRADSLRKNTRTKCILAFIDQCNKRGFEAGIYASDSWYFDMLNYEDIKSCKKWVARYGKPVTLVKDNIVGWQKSSSNLVSGANGGIDTSDWYIDIDKSMSKIKKASKPKEEEKVEKKEDILDKQPNGMPSNIKDQVKAAKITDGAEITLKDTPLYASSTAEKASKTKSGKFYVWSDVKRNGRIRITNSSKNVKVNGKVTGWIDVADI